MGKPEGIIELQCVYAILLVLRGVAWKCILSNLLPNLSTEITVHKIYVKLNSQLSISREFPSLEAIYPLLFQKKGLITNMYFGSEQTKLSAVCLTSVKCSCLFLTV